jgi:hypothetical protein
MYIYIHTKQLHELYSGTRKSCHAHASLPCTRGCEQIQNTQVEIFHVCRAHVMKRRVEIKRRYACIYVCMYVLYVCMHACVPIGLSAVFRSKRKLELEAWREQNKVTLMRCIQACHALTPLDLETRIRI